MESEEGFASNKLHTVQLLRQVILFEQKKETDYSAATHTQSHIHIEHAGSSQFVIYSVEALWHCLCCISLRDVDKFNWMAWWPYVLVRFHSIWTFPCSVCVCVLFSFVFLLSFFHSQHIHRHRSIVFRICFRRMIFETALTIRLKRECTARLICI